MDTRQYYEWPYSFEFVNIDKNKQTSWKTQPKVIQEETGNLNIWISIKKFETVVENIFCK